MAARARHGRHGPMTRKGPGLDKNGIQQEIAPALGAAGPARGGVIQHGFRPEAT
jgi:hypothetical protein